MRTAPLLVIACVMTATAVAQQPGDERAATVRKLHETMVKPASEAIFNIGREAPTNEAQWTAISRAGHTLAESASLLRLAAPSKSRTRWMMLARQLGTTGRAASRAAEARNLAALMRTSDRLVVVCETCHAPYRQRPGR